MESTKQTIIKNCVTYGSFETAKKISSSPKHVAILLEYLVDNDFGEEAAIIANTILDKEAQETHSKLLPEVSEGYTRNQMVNKYHLELTGEKLTDSKRKLR